MLSFSTSKLVLMTSPQNTPFLRNRWEAEQLWNVSLLPVSTPRDSQPAGAIVVELPLPASRERRRNAA
jgi:hypothetical protein